MPSPIQPPTQITSPILFGEKFCRVVNSFGGTQFRHKCTFAPPHRPNPRQKSQWLSKISSKPQCAHFPKTRRPRLQRRSVLVLEWKGDGRSQGNLSILILKGLPPAATEGPLGFDESIGIPQLQGFFIKCLNQMLSKLSSVYSDFMVFFFLQGNQS